jgi:hypothetical protein
MFDLEQSVATWRGQMRAAGIKDPVILDELENHLREDVALNTKADMDEVGAFHAAVAAMGQAQALREEFRKVRKYSGIIREILLILGWLAAGTVQWLGSALLMVVLDIAWNIANSFASSPNFDWPPLVKVMLCILASGVSSWFLARASRGMASSIVSALVCLALWACAVSAIRDRWLGEPLWFSLSFMVLFLLPGFFWIWWKIRHMNQHRAGTNPASST